VKLPIQVKRRGLTAAMAAATAALALYAGAGPAAAAGNPAAGSPAAAKPAATPHVMVIMMENTDYSQAIGSAAMPYLNELAHEYTGFTQSYGWHYPSLPNYMELMAGSNLGITSDCDPGSKGCTNLAHEKFVDQLEAAGISWHAYYQDDVSGCNDNPGDFFHGNYDVEHNAFAYFADFKQQCKHLSNFGPLLSNLSRPDAPDYNYVVPDLDNDGGDNGTMSSGDTWLAAEMPRLMATPWYRQGGQIVIMYDTGYGDSGGFNGSSGGQIPPIVVVSAHTRGMGLRGAPLNTAGVLRSLDHAYSLPYLGNASDPANGSLGSALVAGRPRGAQAAQLYDGALATTGAGGVSVRRAHRTLAFSGVYRYPDGSTVEAGENAHGEGVIDSPEAGVVAVPGSSNLESVSCPASNLCWAAGLATAGTDQAVLVKIVNGQPVSVRRVASFYGLYGISCPAKTSCEAVGYDTSGIADAVTTITNGKPSAPAEVKGGGEWLNAISCPSTTQCYAAGLVNYVASIVPITSGMPQTPVAYHDAWYVGGIACPSVGNCVMDGEAGNTGEGMVTTLAGGKAGPVRPVPGTEYLYGVGCVPGGDCLLAGASQAGVTQYSHGVLVTDHGGVLGRVRNVPGTNGFGQVACGASTGDCVTVGAAAGPRA
jgi:phosphatidylinositol-3-phosphatase